MTKISKGKGLASQKLLIAIGTFIAIFMGIFAAIFGATVGTNLGILLAVPVAMMICFLFFFDRYSLLFLIILSRSAIDPILDATKLGSFGLGALLNALVIVIAFLAIIERPKPALKVFSQTWLAFLIVVFFSIFMAPDLFTAVKTFLVLFSYASIFTLAIVLVQSERDYGHWMRAVFFSSIIPVLYGFIDLAGGGFKGQESEGLRISSTFSHPNIFAFYLVLMVSLSFYFYKVKASYIPSYIRSTLPIYIFIMLGLMVLTKTRSAWASCFAFFAIYSVIYERKYILYLILVPIVAFMIPEVRDRFLDLTQGNEVVNYSKLNSFAWRKMLWQSGIDFMATSHYFLGYGLESFRYYSVSFFALGGGIPRGAHSVYVELFFEIGGIGLATFIWIHLKVGKMLLQYYKQNPLMIFSAIMFLLEFALDAYSDNMLTYLSFDWYLWFVLGAAYAVNYAKSQQSESDEQSISKKVKIA